MSSWATGAAELGWGDGDEATVIPGAAITQYFVKDFNVSNPAQYGDVQLQLLKDDGAVVYLNGTEVARSNMPAGPINTSTLASSFLSGTDETTFTNFDIPASLLTSGTNRLAVEVHQAQANNGDGSFNAALLGFAGTETSAPSAPAVSQSGRTANSVNLSWTASSDDRGVAGYFVNRNGTDIAFTNGTTWSDSGLAPTQSYTYQVRAVDTSGNVSTPGSANVGVFAVSDPTLIAAKSVWKYLDNGTDQGTAWRNVGFDDSTWASGAGILGYGRGDEGDRRELRAQREPALPDDVLPAHVQRRQCGRGDRAPAEVAAEGRRGRVRQRRRGRSAEHAGRHDHVADVRRGERRVAGRPDLEHLHGPAERAHDRDEHHRRRGAQKFPELVRAWRWMCN